MTSITNTGMGPDRRRAPAKRSRWRGLLAAGLAAAMVTGAGAVARADDAPAFTQTFGAGLACAFELRVDGYGAGPQDVRTITDHAGNLRYMLLAGNGFDLVYTNEETGATFSTEASPASSQVTYHGDGSLTLLLDGDNVVILYPTDQPAGPSTTLWSGRVVIQIDPLGNWAVRSAIGTALDICAVLSS
jgi:hypothetical protein